jgi:hypothetical protein
MATATYKYARATMAIALAGSGDDWDNGGNIYASDDADAAPGAGIADGVYTNYLGARDFGFNLPDDAIVTGIQVRTEKEGTHIKDKSLMLTLDGVNLIGNDLAALTTAWPDTDTKVVQGGVAETWGLALWGSDVNKSSFGCVIAAIDDTVADVPGVDGVEMQLTYTDLTETLKVSGGLSKGRDIYKELDLFMKDKNTAKKMILTLERGIWNIARVSTSLV